MSQIRPESIAMTTLHPYSQACARDNFQAIDIESSRCDTLLPCQTVTEQEAVLRAAAVAEHTTQAHKTQIDHMAAAPHDVESQSLDMGQAHHVKGANGHEMAMPAWTVHDSKVAKATVLMSPVDKNEWVRGDPGPFGLLCFGMTTCMLMFITTEWAEKAFLPTVFCYALFYGGAGQFVAGVLELIKGNTFGGTAFASYGAFWMGWFLLEFLTHTDKALYPLAKAGKTLWCGLWAFLTLGFFVVTCRKNGCLMTIFSTLVITFALLAGGVWNADCEQAAGYFGFFCGASAIYAAFAFLYKNELGFVLPGVRPVAYI